MKNKFIIATFLSAFLLIAPNVKAANYTDNQTVDSNKTWTIKFIGEIGFDDLTKKGITVTDSKGTLVNVGIQLQDSKTVTVTAPQSGYTAGESYILNIGNKIHSTKGKALKNEYKMNFTIKSDDEVVTFKDKNLEQAVRKQINKSTGDIYKSDIQNITSLSASDKGVQDISGIENLTNLQTLDLMNNNISDISSLKNLTKLQKLNLMENQITDISELKNLINLQFLDFSYNEISDINALKDLTNLQTLGLCYNQVSDINVLKNLTNLHSLEFSINKQISDTDIKYLISALPKCNIYVWNP